MVSWQVISNLSIRSPLRGEKDMSRRRVVGFEQLLFKDCHRIHHQSKSYRKDCLSELYLLEVEDEWQVVRSSLEISARTRGDGEGVSFHLPFQRPRTAGSIKLTSSNFRSTLDV